MRFRCAAAPSTPKLQTVNVTASTPLILEKNEGERRILRGWPGHPDSKETFILKVDPKDGGSSHLVFMTGDLAPAESVQAAFRTSPGTNRQRPEPPRNTPVRLVTFSSPKGCLVHTLGS